MRGEFIGVWSEAWREIWLPLIGHDGVAHEKPKDAMKDLYGFASDYPGIRQGGTPANAIRAIEMRDRVAMFRGA